MQELETRRSIRRYEDKDVPNELITKLLEAARVAPSGKNVQPWRFIVIRDPEKKAQIAKADHDQKWMLEAPVFIACLGDLEARRPNSKDIVADERCAEPDLKPVIRDTSIAITQLMLEAEALGLGTCWTGWYAQKEMREVLKTPAHMYIVGVLTVGYAAEAPRMRPRMELSEFVSYEEFEAK